MENVKMTDIPKENAFDPDGWYELHYLAFRWKYTGGTKNLEKALRAAGATVKTIGKGIKLVNLKPLCDS